MPSSVDSFRQRVARLGGPDRVALALAGLQPRNSKAITPPATARQLLDRMVETYRKAHSYADSGQLRLAYRKQGADLTTQTADESVTFVRPNKLRMHCYQAIVICDGKQLHATVADLPGQVLDVPAPAELTREDLFSDEILAGVLTQGLAGESIQLALLTLNDPLKPILEGAEEPTLLPARDLEGDECQRVEVKRADGSVVFWIDQKNLLRRLDYPTDELKKQIVQHEQGTVSEVSLSCEFNGARINERIKDVAFEFSPPAEAKLVKRLPGPARADAEDARPEDRRIRISRSRGEAGQSRLAVGQDRGDRLLGHLVRLVLQGTPQLATSL